MLFVYTLYISPIYTILYVVVSTIYTRIHNLTRYKIAGVEALTAEAAAGPIYFKRAINKYLGEPSSADVPYYIYIYYTHTVCLHAPVGFGIIGHYFHA